MKVLQLANGYLGNRLYSNLFAVQKDIGIENTIYVPIGQGQAVPTGEPDDVVISPCFSTLDRLLFFRKQKKMLQDLETLNPSRFDVVHAHTVFSGGYSAYRLHKKYGLPYIVAVRNTDVNVFFKYMLHLRKTGIEILRNAEKVIFLSPVYQEHVFDRYIPARYRDELLKKSLVIPNGIAPLFFQNLRPDAPAPQADSLCLIYVGELSSNKNLELTVQAAQLLRDQGLDVSVTAVGAIKEDKYREFLKRTPFLTHLERCPQEEVIRHLRQANIFVMPSHTETFGLVYAEAMSQGLPVLYTRGQGFDGQFPDGTVGYAVSDTDATELAEKIKQVIFHYEEMSSNCVRLVDKFDWESIAKEYKEIYQTMISREN